MENRKARVVLGALVAGFVLLGSAVNILGFPNGVGDGDKLPSGCSSCHGSAGTGTVSVSASKADLRPGEAVDVTVTVTEQSLTSEGIAGVFLLKGPVGTQESVTADGWTIVNDPNGNTANYAERSGLSTGVAATFKWALTAPTTVGAYAIYADVKHGGDGPASETSAVISITVSPAVDEGSAAPVIGEPAFPVSADIGSAPDISARITDDKEGVRSASVHYRTPGGADFAEAAMARTDGTGMDGTWSLGVNVGPEPGTMEFYLTATDGNKTARSPASGTFSISVVSAGAPEVSAPLLPDQMELNSTLDISSRMTDKDPGVQLAVLRYKLPGAADFTTVELRLVGGTGKDGLWSVAIGTGPAPGVLEIYLAATDGENDARSPATGSYTVRIVKPNGPALDVAAPGAVTFGSSPEVRASASDPLGVVSVLVHFKQKDEAAFRVAGMTLRGGNATDGEWATTLPVGNATGEYSFFVVARSPLSDTQSEARTVKVLPDLSVSAVTFSKRGIIVKNEVVISAFIENRGDRAVTGLSVQFLDQSYAVGDVRYIRAAGNLTVPANGNVTLSAKWIPQVDGKRNIAVVVDPDNKEEEANEDNNRLVTIVPVGLEPGMGIRFPIPTLVDVWIQLTVVVGIAATVGGTIVYGHMNNTRRRESGFGRSNGGAPGMRTDKGG